MTAATLVYRERTASRERINVHLLTCSQDHEPPLESRVDLLKYSEKIFENAETFEAWSGGTLVGLVAAYLNDASGHTGYITNVSVTREFTGLGVASKLMGKCLERAAALGIEVLALEVTRASTAAIAVYRKLGFEESRDAGCSIIMQCPVARD